MREISCIRARRFLKGTRISERNKLHKGETFPKGTRLSQRKGLATWFLKRVRLGKRKRLRPFPNRSKIICKEDYVDAIVPHLGWIGSSGSLLFQR